MAYKTNTYTGLPDLYTPPFDVAGFLATSHTWTAQQTFDNSIIANNSATFNQGISVSSSSSFLGPVAFSNAADFFAGVNVNNGVALAIYDDLNITHTDITNNEANRLIISSSGGGGIDLNASDINLNNYASLYAPQVGTYSGGFALKSTSGLTNGGFVGFSDDNGGEFAFDLFGNGLVSCTMTGTGYAGGSGMGFTSGFGGAQFIVGWNGDYQFNNMGHFACTPSYPGGVYALFDINNNTGIAKFGDFAGSTHGTYFKIDDPSQTITTNLHTIQDASGAMTLGGSCTANGFNATLGNVYSINGAQVLGATNTGWGTPTGVVTKITNFPGNAATLAQCGQEIGAIINALKTHGIFGV